MFKRFYRPKAAKLYSMQMLIAVIAVVSICVSTACGADNSESSHVASHKGNAKKIMISPQPTADVRRPWNAIHNWAYWLDNPDLKQLASTQYELVVTDYSADGSAQKAFSPKQIATLRSSTCQRRVVSYLSIGQAESYRGYWQPGWKKGSPSWLDAPDPDWEGNYWVHYWDPGWQQVIYHYIDQIIAAGFDGVYLDRIDAYEENYAAGHENDMVRFVTNIAHYARTHSPLGNDFGIIVQNAESLAIQHPDYVKTVTGIAREEVYVQATNKPTSTATRLITEQMLDRFKEHSRSKLVLTVDYTNRPDLIRTTYQRSREKGYVPYVASVGLDRLQLNKGYEPTCTPSK